MEKDAVLDHKFIVIFDKIKLDNVAPAGCVVKYMYNLFAPGKRVMTFEFINDEPKKNVTEKITRTGTDLALITADLRTSSSTDTTMLLLSAAYTNSG